MADGPLSGIRILDLTHVWAGPLSTRTLSDLGAQVVKVERPHGRGPREAAGEPIGGWMGGEPGPEPWNANAIFVKLHRNSRSVAIDLKDYRGKQLFLELVGVVDVVIENFSARAMPSLGLTPDVLLAANPNIIYVTMPGFGASGAYSNWVAFGPSVEPMSGITNVMGYSAKEPRNTAMALMDPTSGMSATSAMLSALRERARTGKGMVVELSLHESGVTFSGPWLIAHQLGETIEPIGNRHPQMAPHGMFRCQGEDNWIAVACIDNAEWQALAQLIPDLDGSLDLAARRACENEIEAAIATWTADITKGEAANRLQSAGVSAGPVYTTPDMLADEQIQARGFFVPLEPKVPVPGNPIKMDGISDADWTPCDRLGGSNAEVLKEWLDWTDEQVQALAQDGVLADKPPI